VEKKASISPVFLRRTAGPVGAANGADGVGPRVGAAKKPSIVAAFFFGGDDPSGGAAPLALPPANAFASVEVDGQSCLAC